MTKKLAVLMVAGCLAAQWSRGDVWQDLAKYKYGDASNAAGEADKLLQQTPVAQHGAIEEALIKVVSAADATPDGKAFACRLLQQVATEKAIPAVAALLPDEVLSHYARLVLERLASPQADAALRAALAGAPDKAKVGIIGSLGERRDSLAAKPIAKLAAHADPAIATAALRALGKIGGAYAAKVLGELKTTDSLEPVRLEAIIHCAQSLRAGAAASLYEQVFASSNASYRVAALQGLFRANENKAVQMAAAILKGDDVVLQRGVLVLAAEGSSAPATKVLASLLVGLPEEQKVGLITALGARGDKAALGAITGCFASTNALVRNAAFMAASKIGDAGTVPMLLGMTDPKAEEALARMTGADVNGALVGALADNKLKVAALKALAARGGAADVPQILKLINESDASDRKALWAGLASLATADDLTAIAAAAFAVKTEPEAASALAAVKSIYTQAPDKGKSYDVVAAYYDQATPAAKACIIGLASAAGTPAALEIERKALKSGDRELYGKAVRALAAWGNETAAGDLLGLAQNAPAEVDRLLTLRGYIQMAATKEFKLNPGERMEMFKKAGALAQRAEEKKAIISGLMLAGSAEALSMVSKYWDENELREEAELTAAKLMEELKSSQPAEVKALATKLLASKNTALADKAKQILADLK